MEKMTQWVDCLLPKLENVSLGPQADTSNPKVERTH